jgi:hexosaminidase
MVRDTTQATYDNARHGGFYTQDDAREIVAYAAERHVNVVPEIEMPGHVRAATAAYPQLGLTEQALPVWTNWGVTPYILNADESTVAFMQDVLTEVLDIFPSKFIHVGGDEAAKDVWKTDPRIQARIKELGLKDEHELQSWFIKRMDQFLTAKGRRLIGWDEILEGGLAPGATVMSWRGIQGGVAAAQSGHDVVMAPGKWTYLDHAQSMDSTEPLSIGGFLPIDTVYSFEPVPAELDSAQARHVLGGQAQLWTEYIPTPKQAEYMAYPRLSALAEVLWTPKEQKDFADFRSRLDAHLKRLDALDVNYRKP